VINTVVTAPAALLALALRFIRTGDPTVSSALALPSSPTALTFYRGDCLLLSIVARTLVNWGEHDAWDSDRWFDYEAWLEEEECEVGEEDSEKKESEKKKDGMSEGIGARPGPLQARALWEHRRRVWLHDWVTSQIPPFIRRVMRRIYAQTVCMSGPSAGAAKLAALMALIGEEEEEEEAEKKNESPSQVKAAPATKSNNNSNAPSLLLGEAKNKFNTATSTNNPPPFDRRDGPLSSIDLDSAREGYCMCLAGACHALGLRYAGTGDRVVRDEILGALTLFTCMRECYGSEGRKVDGSGGGSSNSSTTGEILRKRALARAFKSASAREEGGVRGAQVAASALYAELVGAGRGGGMSSEKALKLTNELIFPPWTIAPTSDSLLPAALSEPCSAWPLTTHPAASTTTTTTTTTTTPPHQSHPFTPAIASALAPPTRTFLETALLSTALALGMVMAGTGDVSSIGALRGLRASLSPSMNYGSYLATGCALGLLGLRGGRATLSRSNASIAALLAAFPPYWPHGSSSNAYYPQALRNLYALAVDSRGIECMMLVPGPHSSLKVLPMASTLKVTLKPVRLVPAHHVPPPLRGKVVAAQHNTLLLRKRSLILNTPFILPELHTIASVTLLSRFAPGRGGGELAPLTLHVGICPRAARLFAPTEGGDAEDSWLRRQHSQWRGASSSSSSSSKQPPVPDDGGGDSAPHPSDSQTNTHATMASRHPTAAATGTHESKFAQTTNRDPLQGDLPQGGAAGTGELPQDNVENSLSPDTTHFFAASPLTQQQHLKRMRMSSDEGALGAAQVVVMMRGEGGEGKLGLGQVAATLPSTSSCRKTVTTPLPDGGAHSMKDPAAASDAGNFTLYSKGLLCTPLVGDAQARAFRSTKPIVLFLQQREANNAGFL